MRLPRTVRLALVAAAIPVLAISLAPQAQAHTPPLRHVSARVRLLLRVLRPAPSTTPRFYPSRLIRTWSRLARPRASMLGISRVVTPSSSFACVASCPIASTVRTLTPPHVGQQGPLAGPHFQYSPDPVTPSTSPAYANADNEIWLDFTTDSKGRGWAIAVQDWQPTADRRPASVVIHLEHTHDGSDPTLPAGTAGARLACLNVGF